MILNRHSPGSWENPAASLQVYLLGTVDFETALSLQQRLVFDISGDRAQAALILCQHNPLITVGRQGSHRHILCDPEEMRSRRWRVRWVNRGGGCLLHVPGQLAIYPILPLDRLGLGLRDYLQCLQQVLITLLSDFSVTVSTRSGQAGLWVGSRLIADIGVAVRDWVTYYGAALNINPALDQFQLVHCGGDLEAPMTSVERERRGPLSPSLIRQRFIEHFAAQFGFSQVHLFTDHTMLRAKASAPKTAYSWNGPTYYLE